MNSIDAASLHKKLSAHEDILLIDVREPCEHELFNIGGISIPMNSIFDHLGLIGKNKPVILYCEKGIRSMLAIQRLSERFGYTNLINLSGGMSAWKLYVNL